MQDDAALVEAIRAGDRDGWAVVYDRYADRLHDYCWSILRDRDEAADALHDAFLTATEKIGQLRDASRLRPWLYAVCRTTCLRRAVPTDEVALVTPPVEADLGGAESDELRRLVWDAAGGLPDRDRAVLDLHLRHGLEGAALGDALGTSAHHATVQLSRVRANVERSLSALLVGRTGRGDCPELDALLAGWDGTLTPLLRKRVARHIDECEVCGERKRRMVSPLALLAGVPLVPAPAALRDRVLGDLEHVSHRRGLRRRGRRRAGAGAAVAIAVAVTTGAVVAGQDGGDPAPTVQATPTTAAPSSTVSTAAVAAGPSSSAAVGAVDPSPGAPATAAPGQLVVVTPAIDLGATGVEGTVRLRNDGGKAASWRASPGAHLSASPSAGSVAPGTTASISVVFDRTAAPEGDFAGTVAFAGAGTVTVRATVDRAPVISNLATDRPRLAAGSSACSTTTASAVVRDESPLTVTLGWRQGRGPLTTSEMSPAGAGRYTGRIGPVTSGGDVSWFVTAVDARGNRTVSPTQTIPVGSVC